MSYLTSICFVSSKVIYQQINPGIKYEYMLPLGATNNLIPRPNPAPAAPVAFGDLSGTGANVPGRYPLDSTTTSGSASAPNYLGANNPPPRSLGAEGGLFQTIQQGSAGLNGIQLASSSGGNSGSNLAPSNYPVSGVASGSYPSSLSSSGSLANLGIVPSQFEAPASELGGNPSSGEPAATVAPVLPKENQLTQPPHHGK